MYDLDFEQSKEIAESATVVDLQNIQTQRRPIKLRATLWSRKAASALVELGITPNQVSISSAVFAALGAGFLILSTSRLSGLTACFSLIAAAGCVQLRLLCNLLDGMVAVEYGKATKSGEIFNEVPDRVSDTALLVAAGYAASAGEFGVAMGWLAACLALCTAYIRAFGARYLREQDFRGPMAKQHRMFVLTVGCVLSAALSTSGGSGDALLLTLFVISAGSLFTCIRRLLHLKTEMEKS